MLRPRARLQREPLGQALAQKRLDDGFGRCHVRLMRLLFPAFAHEAEQDVGERARLPSVRGERRKRWLPRKQAYLYRNCFHYRSHSCFVPTGRDLEQQHTTHRTPGRRSPARRCARRQSGNNARRRGADWAQRVGAYYVLSPSVTRDLSGRLGLPSSAETEESRRRGDCCALNTRPGRQELEGGGRLRLEVRPKSRFVGRTEAQSRVMRYAHLRSPVRGGVRRSGGLCASGVRGCGAIGYRAPGSVGPDWSGLRSAARGASGAAALTRRGRGQRSGEAGSRNVDFSAALLATDDADDRDHEGSVRGSRAAGSLHQAIWHIRAICG